jgi:hypothetical protein
VVATTLLALVWTGCSSTSAGPAATHRDDPRGTTFGSNAWREPGESRRQALARVDATYGPVPLVRVFEDGLPPPWRVLRRDFGHRRLVLSFRMPPEQVLAGHADGRLRRWFRAAPTRRPTYWTYQHEPEDEVERGGFSAGDFRAAWRHVERLAAEADNPRLRATVVLMCWTAKESSGRDWHDYVPAPRRVDLLAWDCYAKGNDAQSYARPGKLFGPARRAAAQVGTAWGVAELGARIARGADGTDRARWLSRVGRYTRRHDARFVTYFDAPIGGSFRLLDGPSVRAWRRQVRRNGPRSSRSVAQSAGTGRDHG